MDTTPAKKPLVLIGSLNAHITGDFRYNDSLKVHWDPETDTVRVRVFTTGAVGGMDSGRSDSYEPRADFDQSTGPKPTVKVVMDLIKRAISNDRFLFKRYGKPTKNFRWVPNTPGFSAKLCAGALAWARETQ
jgi:hypothetical protein